MLSIVAYIALAILGLTAIPSAVVLGRHAFRRYTEKRAKKQLSQSQELLLRAQQEEQAPEVFARSFGRRFPQPVTERLIHDRLRESTEQNRTWLVKVCLHLGLSERYLTLVREATSWGERAHAAEMLGLLGLPVAVPQLVAALRDPHEDTTSVKLAAAEALAKIRDPEAILLLTREFFSIDQWSSPRVAEALVGFGSAAVPALTELLTDEAHPSAPVWAARTLGRIGDRAATPALLDRLHDRQDAVRIAAAEALGALGDRRGLEPLIRATLRDPIPQVRAHAAAAIGHIGDEGATDVLVAALADPDFGTRMRALEALETIRPENLSPLERALRDANPEVRRRAALVLERVGYLDRLVEQLGAADPTLVKEAYAQVVELGRAGLVDGIAAHLHHKQFEVRSHIAKACGELGAQRVAPLLMAALDDPEWPVRARVVEALGRLHPDGGALALSNLLADPEMVVREMAAQALLGFPEVTLALKSAQLVEAFDRGSATVRACAVELAGRLNREELMPLFIRASEDPNEEVRARALAPLAARSEQFSLAPLVARLADTSLNVRLAAVDALGRLDTNEAADALLRSLVDALPEVREQIAQALARGEKPLRERVLRHVDSANIDVLLGIAWALGKAAKPDGVPVLARFLKSADARLRASAAGALGKIRNNAAVEVLMTAIEDRAPRTRAAVVNALGRQGQVDVAVVSGLSARLNDPDAFVRNRTAIALGRLGGDAAEQLLLTTRASLERASLAIAQGLLGTEAAVLAATDALGNPALFPKVRALLDSEDPALRRAFFSNLRLEDPGGALAETLDERGVVDQYIQSLKSSQDPRNRRVAVQALVRLSKSRATEALCDALSADPDEEVRLRAASILESMTDSELVCAALVRAVNDPSKQVALLAIRALGRTREVRFASSLFARVGEGKEELELAAEDALAELFKADPVPMVDLMLGADRPAIVLACARVLGRISTPKLLPLLREFLKSPDASLRAVSVRAISTLPLPEARTAVVGALSDRDAKVREAAVDSLVATTDPSTLPILAALRFDPAVSVRSKLAESLGRFSGDASLQLLDELASDLAAPVRGASLLTLLARADVEGLTHFFATWAQAAPEVRAFVRASPSAVALSERLATLLAEHAQPQVRSLAVAAIAALATPDFHRLVLPALADPSAQVRLAAVRAIAGLDSIEVKEPLQKMLEDPNSEVREAAQKARLRVVG